jgi:hypothetical protein
MGHSNNFSSVSLVGTSSADLASMADDVYFSADKDNPVTKKGNNVPRHMEKLTMHYCCSNYMIVLRLMYDYCEGLFSYVADFHRFKAMCI